MQVSRAEEVILISAHLVLAISKQPARTSKEVLRNAGAVVADGRAALSYQEDRSRRGHGFENSVFDSRFGNAAGAPGLVSTQWKVNSPK